MIKVRMSSGSVLLGITAENVERLLAGQPILLNLKDIGLPSQQIAIIYGPTIADLMDQLRENGMVLPA